MRAIPPVSITPARLISSTASELHAPAAYSAGTTYGFGAIVSVAADFKIYESLAAGNTGNTPKSSPLWWRAIGVTEAAYNAATTYALGDTVSANQRCYESLAAGNTGNPLPVLPETQTDKWVDVGPTNRWAMFDLERNTQTVVASPLTVVFAPGQRVNSVGLCGMSANSLTISATSALGGGTVYGPKTVDLNTRAVLDGYDYAFEPFGTQPSWVAFDLPPFSDIVITITLSSTAGNVKCGSVVVGTFIYLGDAQYGASNDGLNFSTITRDLYGNTTLVRRRTVPKTTQQLKVAVPRINKVLAARSALNAVPALWAGLDGGESSHFELFLVMGVYTVFEIDATDPAFATIRLTIEEI